MFKSGQLNIIRRWRRVYPVQCNSFASAAFKIMQNILYCRIKVCAHIAHRKGVRPVTYEYQICLVLLFKQIYRFVYPSRSGTDNDNCVKFITCKINTFKIVLYLFCSCLLFDSAYNSFTLGCFTIFFFQNYMYHSQSPRIIIIYHQFIKSKKIQKF